MNTREEKTFRAYIKAQDDAIMRLMEEYDVPAGEAVRIVHSVAQAAWHRGYQVCADPLVPADKGE